MYDETK
jgi:peroxin-4